MLSTKVPLLLIKNASRTKPACSVAPERAWNNLHHYIEHITHWNLIWEVIPAFSNPCCTALILEMYSCSQCCFEQAKTQAVMIMAYLPSQQNEILKKGRTSAARFLIYYFSSLLILAKFTTRLSLHRSLS